MRRVSCWFTTLGVETAAVQARAPAARPPATKPSLATSSHVTLTPPQHASCFGMRQPSRVELYATSPAHLSQRDHRSVQLLGQHHLAAQARAAAELEEEGGSGRQARGFGDVSVPASSARNPAAAALKAANPPSPVRTHSLKLLRTHSPRAAHHQPRPTTPLTGGRASRAAQSPPSTAHRRPPAPGRPTAARWAA